MSTPPNNHEDYSVPKISMRTPLSISFCRKPGAFSFNRVGTTDPSLKERPLFFIRVLSERTVHVAREMIPLACARPCDFRESVCVRVRCPSPLLHWKFYRPSDTAAPCWFIQGEPAGNSQAMLFY